MTISRWNPFHELEQLLDQYNRSGRYLQNTTGSGYTGGKDLINKADWIPAVDIAESATAYHIKAELPGVDKNSISVSVKDGVLTIQGERQSVTQTENAEQSDFKYHRIERSYGSFARAFSLPEHVNEEDIQAQFKDGILDLTLLKKTEQKPKSIEVKVH
ncbi:MAG: Hsp20/alpha crystallin family protein [Pseudomonadales bacterium]|nr:Hsp20/alpha crystallin family protein [Pseudomonadales bacterium]